MLPDRDMPEMIDHEGLARIAGLVLAEDQPRDADQAFLQIDARLGAYGAERSVFDKVVARYLAGS